MPMLLQLFFEVIWFLLPAGVANTVPVLAAHWRGLPMLNVPLDRGVMWRGVRLLGDHKTLRGLVLGVIFGSITGYFQHLIFVNHPAIQSIALVSYRSALGALWLGAWLGFGGLLGDLLKSLAKRQPKIAPGKPWRPLDQIDLAIGAV